MSLLPFESHYQYMESRGSEKHQRNVTCPICGYCYGGVFERTNQGMYRLVFYHRDKAGDTRVEIEY